MAVLRALLLLLSSPRLVERLSESRPIRAAARVTAGALTRGQRHLAPRLLRLRDAFLAELKDGARARPGPRPCPGCGWRAADWTVRSSSRGLERLLGKA
uniref:Secreted protein n=1 Tax=Taeniopygia guttata TaxID=59729 RepID=A0A674GT90_TAEGU